MSSAYTHPLTYYRSPLGAPESEGVCPDDKAECKIDQSCCLMTQGGEFGCCPLGTSVCCPDLKHCCPEGYSCADENCVRDYNIQQPDDDDDELVDQLTLQASLPHTPLDSDTEFDVICPGGNQKCSDGYTCCPSDDTGKSYFCCLDVNATCCPNMITCCPVGYRCDPSTGKCYPIDGLSHPLLHLA